MSRRGRRAWLAVRVAGICVLAVVIGGAGSCGTSGSSSVTATGTTLKIYASVPAGSPDRADLLAAERMALSQGGAQVGKFRLQLVALAATKLSDNARSAIEDTSAVAYVGELAPGASRQSLGITNALDLLQVTPSDTAVELTEATPAVPSTPDRYYESLKTYGRTFARVVPNSQEEAKAQVQEMQTLRVQRLYVTSDASQYGRAIAQAVRSAAQGKVTLASSQASADAVFYGTASAAAGESLFDRLALTRPDLKLFGPSTLQNASFSPGVRNVYVSSAGMLPSALPPSGQAFISDFRAATGHAPPPAAIFAYAAMSTVVAVLHEAGGDANNRATVVKDFFAIKNRSSVLGTFSINANGDTSLGSFVFSKSRAGHLVPVHGVQVQG